MVKNYISKTVLSVIIITLAGVFIYVGWSYYKLHERFLSLERDLAKSNEEKDLTAQNLEAEKEKNKLFANQIKEITGTVVNLDKLAKIDKELLQKYSKVYFLNEHYTPERLISLPPDYLYEKSREMKFHEQAYPYLQEMIVAAKKDGIELKVVSAYRSFGDQGALKNNYSVTYGSGANAFSADQGYSEHQLGTTIDFTTPETGPNFSQFKTTAAYSWLLTNAYKYGFILSYPENNSYYQFEPWHWRFVGKVLANRLNEDGQHFYDLDQHIIDLYLLSIFN